MPYSPVARPVLTGAYSSVEDRAKDDFRRSTDLARDLADALHEAQVDLEIGGWSPVPFALASLLHQGEDVVPTPGTNRVTYVEENAAAGDIALCDEQLAALDAAVTVGAVAGDRYPQESVGSIEL